MAIKIDNDLLQELGLASLPEIEKNSLLKHIYETLEMRVGMRLADQMTNEQLDEFEQYFEAKDDAGAFKWLETNFPNYKEIVQEEFDKLKIEVGQSAPQILTASQQQPAQVTPAAEPSAVTQSAQEPGVVAPTPQAEVPVAASQPVPPVEPWQPPVQPAATPAPIPAQPAVPAEPQPAQQPDYPTQQPPAGPGPQTV